MIIPLSLNDEETGQLKKLAKEQNRTCMEIIRLLIKEKIQDSNDWVLYKEAFMDYQIVPRTYSLDKVKRERGI